MGLSKTKPKKIVVVGQTPPPYHGQAVMIQKIVTSSFDSIKIFHVRMAFSKEMDEIGKFQPSKFLHLFEIIFRILYLRIRHNISTLYYPPAGPSNIAFYRDLIILISVRPFFKETVFHFHAAGLSELYSTLNRWFKFLFRKAYYFADIGIRLSVNTINDCVKLKVKKDLIIPYGTDDLFHAFNTEGRHHHRKSILFVGLLSESKGLLILLNACEILKEKGLDFTVNIMGKFESRQFEKFIKEKITQANLDKYITFHGVKTGSEKSRVFADSDIFCFPSFYEAESFPVVLLEASSFALPIVSTQWRGIPSIVLDSVNGFLTPVKNETAVADKLTLLLTDDALRETMGKKSRQLFLEKYTLEIFTRNIEQALSGNQRV